ncbi:MAG: AAA family ATPase [Gammaproteobacteria bacterium]|nr:AAA family ATPase [Gammaproteobacteria bacterium]
MKCPGCQREPPPGSAFCNHCGARLELVCPACGARPPPGSRFCNECGANLTVQPAPPGGAAAPPKAVPPQRSPRDYTPKHLADQILRSRAALAGERKLVTVLFADVKGSMALAEQLDAETWHEVLDRFFEILADGVHRFEGTINQFTGDGIMALFGAPIAHEDHAQRACYAALHLHDALRAYANELRRTQGLNLAVRMGLNSGVVVVGAIGDDLRMDYTAQGQTVGLAQRMEQLAAADSAYLAAATAKLVEGYVDLRALGEFTLKGVSEPLAVFELAGTGALRSRLDASRVRGFSRFVGRGHEMATLEAALERSLATHGLTVGVVAEAGTGKSRLCHEFLERCRARDFPVIEVSAVSHGRNVPLLPMLALFRAFFGVRADDDALTAREKIAGRLMLLDDSLRDDLPIFFNLLGVPDPARPLPAIGADELQRRAFAAIRALTRADGQRDKPAVVCIEDLHWLDAASDNYLVQIVEATSTSRGLLLVNFRPEYRADWMQTATYQQIPLAQLDTAAVRELLGELLGHDASVDGMAEFVYQRAGGNPFFVEEIVQTLVETGALVGARGAYRLVRAVDALVMPTTVQALLAARIDRLAERDKQLLQQAAVIGRTFEARVLIEVSALPAAEFEAAMRTLRETEFVNEVALYPRLEYGFKHPLTQEVANDSQLKVRRAETHARVARAIEALSPEHLDEEAAMLAHHWAAAGEAVTAARWHARAARWIGISDYHEAAAHWQRACEMLAGDHDDAGLLRERAEMVTNLLLVAYRVGIPADDAAAWFDVARRDLERLGDLESLTLLHLGYTGILQNAGRVHDDLAVAAEGEAIARRTGSAALRAAAGVDLSYCLMMVGKLADSCAMTLTVRELCGDDVTLGMDYILVPAPIFGYTVGAIALVESGRMADAVRDIDHGFALAMTHGSDEMRCWAHWSRLVLVDARGAHAPEVLDWARLAIEAAERSGSRQARMVAHCLVVLARVLERQWGSSSDHIQHARELWHQGIAGDFAPWMLTIEARDLHGMGETESACETSGEAIELARKQGQPVTLCEAIVAHVPALRRRDGAAAATSITALLDEMERLIEGTGAERWRPHVHRERGELALLRDDAATARREFGTALDLFTAMGADGHAERLRTRLATH